MDFEAHRLWKQFEDEIIYKNRFFPQTEEMLEKIKSTFPKIERYVDCGEVWFRAREFETSDEQYASFIYNADNCCRASEKKHFEKHYAKIIKQKEETCEWGYQQCESGIPPRDKAGLNRASPKYIPYLYLANTINTALAEVRASLHRPFSVAKYVVTKKLKIIDFSLRDEVILEPNGFNEEEETIIYMNVSGAFHNPSQANEKDYLVSQYIAEYIKMLGYDGIKFNSSQKIGGRNLTLFEDTACRFFCSEIHEVTEIKINSMQILPMVDDKFDKGEQELRFVSL